MTHRHAAAFDPSLDLGESSEPATGWGITRTEDGRIVQEDPETAPDPSSTGTGLTESWQAAVDAMPAGWALCGIARGPRDTDPTIQSSGWVAWASGSGDERLQGAGGTPEDALQQLRVHLREFASLVE